jgi:hypothetical protein
MWWTIFQRFAVPFEIEWNEGHTAEQAWRFATGQPLYPAPESGWVPYMYAPGHHIILGTIYWFMGGISLPVGRLLSVLATAGTQAALVLIVWDRTRRLSSAFLALTLYAATFRLCGFCFDLVRVDSLGLAFALWAMYFVLRRKATTASVASALLLAAIAAAIKQPFALLWFFAAFIGVFRSAKGTLLGVVGSVLLGAQLFFLLSVAGSTHIWHYTVTNALEHLSRHDVFFPGALYPDQFAAARLPEESWLQAYRRLWSEGSAPALWVEFLRHWWILGLVVMAWPILRLTRRLGSAGFLYVIVLLILLASSVSAYAKFGGFVNNFQPFFAGLAIVLAFAVEGLRRASAGWPRVALLLVVSSALVAQVLQPWSMPAMDQSFLGKLAHRDPDPERGRALVTEWREQSRPPAIAMLARAIEPGWGWLPRWQAPTLGSEEAHAALMKWLAERHAAGEPVWMLHHQVYALQTGHPLPYNVDMVRCAVWAGDPVPQALGDALLSGRGKWLVADMRDLKYEWLPAGVHDKIRAGYDFVGPMPGLESIEFTRALMPVTGAEMRPLFIWQSRR